MDDFGGVCGFQLYTHHSLRNIKHSLSGENSSEKWRNLGQVTKIFPNEFFPDKVVCTTIVYGEERMNLAFQ